MLSYALSLLSLMETYFLYASPIIYVLIGAILLRARPKALAIYLLIGIGILAYRFNPGKYDDLTKYYVLIENHRKLGWNVYRNLYSDNIYFDSAIGFQLLLWGFSFFSDAVIKVVPALVIGALALRLCLAICIDNQISDITTTRLMAVIFILLNAYSYISSWHYFLTLVILANLLYTELFRQNKKILCWCGYFALCFFHSIGITFLLFRIIAFARNKIIFWGSGIVLLTWRMWIKVFSLILNLLPNNAVLINFSNKLDLYNANFGQESLQLVYQLGLIIFAVVVLYLASSARNHDKEHAALYSIIVMASVFALGSFGSLNLVFRYCHFTMFFLPILLVKTEMFLDEESIGLWEISFTSKEIKWVWLLLGISVIMIAGSYITTQYYVLFK